MLNHEGLYFTELVTCHHERVYLLLTVLMLTMQN
jgi:hypothetical protein